MMKPVESSSIAHPDASPEDDGQQKQEAAEGEAALRKVVDQIDCSLDGVVVGDTQHIDPRLGDSNGDLVGCCRRVTAPHRVAVHVDPHPTSW